MRTFINGDSALVCSIQNWDTVSRDDKQASFMMRQTDCLEKQNGDWKIRHK